ncbi:MAG: hypothetical protein RR123_05910 [Clostridia bacterium]
MLVGENDINIDNLSNQNIWIEHSANDNNIIIKDDNIITPDENML